ncbi:hypothetical protein BX666DRAFT_1933812 [Dichotomocladium elegans]|nr:hypothetical protein BX666DRAFT_1933812 [Dichotomocladium elegans]
MATEQRCVDYLAHEWYPTDLITTHREIRRQARSVNPKETYRLARFQNALWRQMARTLTTRLGKFNAMVDPATVDW